MEKVLDEVNPNLILYETNLVEFLDKKIYQKYKNKLVIFLVIEQFTNLGKQKILEFDSTGKESFFHNCIIESIIEYGDSEMIDLWNYKDPGSIRHYLERTSLCINNTKNILWLVDNYGLSFFDYERHLDNKIYYAKKDNKVFKELIKRINFRKYTETKNIIDLIWDIEDYDVLEIVFEKTSTLKRLQNIHKDLLNIALSNNNKRFIKYYFDKYKEKKDYDKKYIDMCILHNFEEGGYYTSNQYKYCPQKKLGIISLSPTLNLVYNKLIEIFGKSEIINYIRYTNIHELDGYLITSIIRFKCTKILKDIYTIIGTQDFKNMLSTQVLEDLFKYGQHCVMKYLMELEGGKIMKEKLENLNEIDSYISNALCNSDDRMLKYIIPFIKDKSLYLDYNFLTGSNTSTNTKIRKTKILLKHTKLNVNNFLYTSLEYSDDVFIIWLIKKIFNSKLPNGENTIGILSKLLVSNNLNTIKYAINSLDTNFNYWYFIIVLIKCHVKVKYEDYIINNIFTKLNNLNKNKQEFNDLICKEIRYFNAYYAYNDYNRVKLEELYDKYLGILKQCGFNFENYTNHGRYESLLVHNNTNLFKIGIKHGLSFPNYFKNNLSIYDRYHLFSNFTKPYVKMYRLIRRIEIAREIKIKKQHKSFFEDTNVCIKSRPPTQRSAILSKSGGQLFYRDMEVMGVILNEQENFVNPVHITPMKLLELSTNPILITPKIDGVTKFNVNELMISPSFPDYYENYEVDAEYVKELNMYLVFGVRNKQNYYNCIYEDYNELKDIHPYTKYDSSPTMITSNNHEVIKKMVYDEFRKIIDYRQSQEGAIWYPKKFWMIHDTDIILNVIETLQYIQEEIIMNLPCLGMSCFLENNFIKTDGYIINKLCNKKESYKLKPSRDMTIDLRYNGEWKDREGNTYNIDIGEHNFKGIYRCEYKNDIWKARDYRPEKLKPNPKSVVDIVMDFHNNPWDISELKKYHQNNYYQEFKKNPKLVNMNNDKLNWLNKFIKNNQKILDIGCGYMISKIWKNPTLEIDGIDHDIKIIDKYNKIHTPNKKVFIQDICKSWRFKDDCIKKHFNQKLEMKKYDIILMNLSIHYSFKENCGFLNLMREVNKRSDSKTNLMISFIDKNKLFSKKNIVKFRDGGYMKLLDKDNGYSQMKYFYPWRHNYPIVEPILEMDDLVSYLESLGWYKKDEYQNKFDYEDKGYKELSNSITRLVFVKLNF